jgi:hypothetical protein
MRICEHCNKKFKPKKELQRYCSRECVTADARDKFKIRPRYYPYYNGKIKE